jgi:hypothetical protein
MHHHHHEESEGLSTPPQVTCVVLNNHPHHSFWAAFVEGSEPIEAHDARCVAYFKPYHFLQKKKTCVSKYFET